MTNDNFEKRMKYRNEKSIYLVNPGGAVHNLPETLANERLQQGGWREATEEEIQRLKDQKGAQGVKPRTRIAKRTAGAPGLDAGDVFNEKKGGAERI